MNRRAFTLVELLVVISIIGLLSAVATVSMSSARSKARDAKRMADKNQIIKALNLYYADNGVWPDDSGDWRCFGAPSGEGCWPGYIGSNALVTAMSPYMASFPKSNVDPGTNAYNRYLYTRNWNGSTWDGQGAFLIWYKENTMASSECPSPNAVQHFDKYWYCYEFLGK